MEVAELDQGISESPSMENNKKRLLVFGITISFIIGLLGFYQSESGSLIIRNANVALYSFLGFYWIILDSSDYEIYLTFTIRRLIIWFGFIMVIWYMFRTRKLAGFYILGKLIIYSLLLVLSQEVCLFFVRLIRNI
jgi:hypothetical protein